MYILTGFSDGYAHITDDAGLYNSSWLAADADEAQAIVNQLNTAEAAANAEAAASAARSALADYRFRVETGGVDVGGVMIMTDRESQAQLQGAMQALQAGYVRSVDWKGADGWASVTKEQIEPIAQAVAIHVQSCFSAECAVDAAITSGAAPSDVTGAFDDALSAIKSAADDSATTTQHKE